MLVPPKNLLVNSLEDYVYDGCLFDPSNCQ